MATIMAVVAAAVVRIGMHLQAHLFSRPRGNVVVALITGRA